MKNSTESQILKKLVELLHIIYSTKNSSLSSDIIDSITQIEKHINIIIESSNSQSQTPLTQQVTTNGKPEKKVKKKADSADKRRQRFKVYNPTSKSNDNVDTKVTKRSDLFLSVIGVSSIFILIITSLIKILESSHVHFIMKLINLFVNGLHHAKTLL